MGGPHVDCCSLAKQFHDIDFDVTLWITYPCSPYIVTSSSFNPFSGARHEGPEEGHKSHHRYNSARQVNQC